ncbi:uncharacterized protein LOC142748403 [Rhinoderma darwinii]|uniref:uncharacterized protein LOC142748403 n=1 Tax=Rhinoderma darwinii TaxID=43563 RepID=UPI003F671949
MSFRSCRVGMWSPALTFLLFLILELIAQPGVSQGVKAPPICRECKGLLTEKGVTQKFYQILVERANYSGCPNNIVAFKLPNRTYCGSKMESWVINLIKCIDQGRNPCLQSSESQQDFSKGSNEKPPSTNQESTSSTVRLGPSIRLSTQNWKEGTFKPSETTIEDLLSTQKILETTTDLTSRGPATTGLTSRGPINTVLTSRGPTTSDLASRGQNTTGFTSRGPTTTGLASRGPNTTDLTSRGPTTTGLTSRGPITTGLTSRGPTTTGLTSRGPTTSGLTSRGPTTTGLTSRGPTTTGLTSRGRTTTGLTSRGPSTTGLNSRGPTTTGLTSTGLLTTAPDSDSNNSLLHGNETPNKVDEESKTKKMSIAIILLLLIVLGMTAVGTYFWCRKGKSTKCVKKIDEKNSGKYELTLLEDLY